MNAEALLALLADLYSQVAKMQAENAELRAQLAKLSGDEDVPPN